MINLDDFATFVEERHPDTGTAASYRNALKRLDMVLKRSESKPTWVPDELLLMGSSAAILELKHHIKIEQDHFKVGAPSIFERYRGRGDGYFRKGWCSAALGELAAFVRMTDTRRT